MFMYVFHIYVNIFLYIFNDLFVDTCIDIFIYVLIYNVLFLYVYVSISYKTNPETVRRDAQTTRLDDAGQLFATRIWQIAQIVWITSALVITQKSSPGYQKLLLTYTYI